MAEILPFKAVIYNPEKFKSLNRVISPPYDIIPPLKQKELLKRNPYNVVRLELPSETRWKESQNKYEKAKKTFEKWVGERILISDKTSSFYLYKQDFILNKKRYLREGFFSILKLEKFGGNVFPHEKTLSKPKKDRRALLRECRVNFSPIFCFFTDPSNKVLKTLNLFKGKLMSYSTTDENVKETLYRINNSSAIKKVKLLIENKKIFIADGHHRYETGLEFARATKKYGYILIYSAPVETKGLIVLPTHRLLKKFNFDKIKKRCGIKEMGKKEMITLMQKNEKSFGLYFNGNFYLIIPKIKTKERIPTELLHKKIIQEIPLSEIEYSKDMEHSVLQVKQKRFKAAIFLNPTPISEIKRVALKGKTMPQKSTYFWPKLSTGFVMHKL